MVGLTQAGLEQGNVALSPHEFEPCFDLRHVTTLVAPQLAHGVGHLFRVAVDRGAPERRLKDRGCDDGHTRGHRLRQTPPEFRDQRLVGETHEEIQLFETTPNDSFGIGIRVHVPIRGPRSQSLPCDRGAPQETHVEVRARAVRGREHPPDAWPLAKIVNHVPPDDRPTVPRLAVTADTHHIFPIFDGKHRRPVAGRGRGETPVRAHQLAHTLRYGNPYAFRAEDFAQVPSTLDRIVLDVSAVAETMRQSTYDDEQPFRLHLRRPV